MPGKPQNEKKHPDRWEMDLNPHAREGQNIGAYSPDEDARIRYASDIKYLVSELQDFTVDELKDIPVLPVGTQLKQGAVYVDLQDPDREVFTASDGVIAGEENWYVPKSGTPFEYWNRLLGLDDVDRTHKAG